MHIEEAVLTISPSGMMVLAGGWGLSAIGVGLGLRRMDYERIPQVAMLTSAFFVASLIHVPLGFTSVHLVLNGLVGLVLGWAAFPAIFVALALQMLLFGFGGLTTLGINTLVMALPAIVVYAVLNRGARAGREAVAFGSGFAAGALGIALGATLLAGTMLAAGDALDRVAPLVLAAHLPLAIIEGFVTAGAVMFLRRVRPEVLVAPLAAPVGLEVSDG
jgi:cobalt/nickel transport system permease protein